MTAVAARVTVAFEINNLILTFVSVREKSIFVFILVFVIKAKFGGRLNSFYERELFHGKLNFDGFFSLFFSE